MNGFSRLSIPPHVLEALKSRGIIEPTPVQAQAIPLVRSGRDVIIRSQTGTGKTLAYLLPILDKLKPNVDAVQALVILPTRELAMQVGSVAGIFSESYGIHALTLCGGQDIFRQMEKLKRTPQLIIGTPGRLKDLMRRRAFTLASVNKIVLDEADEMLKLGFIEDIEDLISSCAKDYQLLLLSATIPERITRLAKRFMNNPSTLIIKSDEVVIDTIKQVVITATEEEKLDRLSALINEDAPYLAMIFCSTKEKVHRLTLELARRGYLVDELSGDLTQVQRNLVLKRFREAKLQLLCATDIAARGLDIVGVTNVYNYDLPLTVEDYIHRVGRTGRAGEAGQATTLVTPKQHDRLRRIEAGIKAKIKRELVRKKPKSLIKSSENAGEKDPMINAKGLNSPKPRLKNKKAPTKAQLKAKAKRATKTVSNMTRRSRKRG